MSKSKKALSIVLAVLMVTMTVVSAYAAKAFPFEDTNMWAKDSIQWAWENGMVNGVTEAKFMPNRAVTYEEFAVMLYRFVGEPEPESAEIPVEMDKNAYSYDALCWATENNIVFEHTYVGFSYKNAVNRSAAAEGLLNLFYYEYNLEYPNGPWVSLNIPDFPDFYTDVDTNDSRGLKWAVYWGIIQGKTPTELKPYDNLTRAEFTTILHRYKTPELRPEPAPTPSPEE